MRTAASGGEVRVLHGRACSMPRPPGRDLRVFAIFRKSSEIRHEQSGAHIHAEGLSQTVVRIKGLGGNNGTEVTARKHFISIGSKSGACAHKRRV